MYYRHIQHISTLSGVLILAVDVYKLHSKHRVEILFAGSQFTNVTESIPNC